MSRAQMRNKGCYPSFILAGGGPRMCILGAVFTDKFIVQRPTDMMWIGLSSTNEDARTHRFARTIMALRQSLQDLDTHYTEISTAEIPSLDGYRPRPRFYPYPTSFLQDVKVTHFDYVKMTEDDARCMTFLAKTKGDLPSPDIVKFANAYGDQAHRFLADRNYAPKLRYCGPLGLGNHTAEPGRSPLSTTSTDESSMKMMVMDYVAPHARPADAREQVAQILTELHTAGFVFGDLREPNILFNEEGKVQLTDLNWAGSYDMQVLDTRLPPGLEQKIRDSIPSIRGAQVGFARCPLALSRSISWAEGVGGLLPIRPQHDWEMLDKL
ncbi:hypothetical protein H0H81_007034 [Sphagnurus paluster]|uniref:Protein kinase domain-containing protein n=1 Tax=Sphagnurus paluster TaxID=117069 RepID=A0A9P7K7N9_9AGAR|nr:hypothetical protein H0H81_007034 [Sphagnurus paluster]